MSALEPIVIVELTLVDKYTAPASANPCGAPAPSGVCRGIVSGGVHRAKARRDRGAGACGRVYRTSAGHFILDIFFI